VIVALSQRGKTNRSTAAAKLPARFRPLMAVALVTRGDGLNGEGAEHDGYKGEGTAGILS
jgi:hypothetical protein